MILSAVFK